MYNSIPLWKTLGSSSGKIALKPDDETYDVWHQWLKENQSEEYLKQTTQKEGVAGPPTGVKQKVINMIFVASKIDAFKNQIKRMADTTKRTVTVLISKIYNFQYSSHCQYYS